MNSVSIFGLGIIGSRIAKHLNNQGVSVTVWNRSPKAEFSNAVVTPIEAAQANKLLAFYLKDNIACLSVLDAIKPALTPEHTIVNHSTIDLATVRHLAATCQEIGCTYIDAPFTGSKMPAENGQLVYYVAGDEAKINELNPYLEQSSKAILYTGAIGTATVLKLVTNMISATMMQSLSEALATTKAHGISGARLLDAMNLNVVSSPLANFKLPYMDRGDFDAHFSLDNMRKDSTYCLQLAQEKGLTLPAGALVNAIMTELCEQGKAGQDFCSLATQF